MSLWKKNLILIFVIIAICAFPIMVLKDAKFDGVDGIAEDVIMEIVPDYEPWFEPFFEPASGEVESLLFALQAAIGSGVVCYILGRMTANPREDKIC